MADEQVEREEALDGQLEQPAPGAEAPAQPAEGGDAAEVAALEERLLRLAADFDNYRKRAAREREEYVVRANERLVVELLPILDDLERALAAAEEHAEAQLEEGVRLVHRSLAALLERYGVKPIATDGKFDPHVHEALLSQPSEAEEGSVIDVVQKGYTLGDRVVRPARVVVAAPPARAEPEPPAQAEAREAHAHEPQPQAGAQGAPEEANGGDA
jgi:molecular chaperone GrpE